MERTLTNTITNRQMIFLLLLAGASYNVVVLPKEMAETSGTGAWIPLLIMGFLFGLGAMAVVYLNSLFKGKTLFEYAPRLVTKPGAYLLVLYYVLYSLFIAVFLISEQAKLIRADFLPDTPLWATQILGILVFCFIAHKGVTNVARMVEIIGVVYIVTAVFVHGLMVTEGEASRILPVYNPREIGDYVRGIRVSIFAFISPFILLAIPMTKENGKKAVGKAFVSMLVLGLFYILIVESCIMKLGLSDIVHYKDALIVAIRDTAPPMLEFLARLDILYLTVGYAGIFLGVSVIFLVVIEFLCRVFTRASRTAVVASVGVGVFSLSLAANGIQGFYDVFISATTYPVIFSTLVIPVILILIAKIRKAGPKERSNAA